NAHTRADWRRMHRSFACFHPASREERLPRMTTLRAGAKGYSFSRMVTPVECVPNFSEGRDKAKVDAIVEAMKMDGVFLLDREMDADHNRCVITLADERAPLPEQ